MSTDVPLSLVPLPLRSSELWLVRHGQSTANAMGIGQGRAEYPLSALGERQALETARHLAAQGPFDALYTSPQGRAAQTAAAIGQAIGLAPVAVGELVEIDVGALSGTTMAGLAGTHPAAIAAYEAAQRARPAARNRELLPGWEPVASIVTRMWNAIATILDDHPGQRVVVVAHGGVINAFLTQLLDGDALERPWAHSSSNCAITQLLFAPEGPRVLRLTDASHLADLASGHTVFDPPAAGDRATAAPAP